MVQSTLVSFYSEEEEEETGQVMSSPGQVEGQGDVQRRPLEAVLGAQSEAGRLLVGGH